MIKKGGKMENQNQEAGKNESGMNEFMKALEAMKGMFGEIEEKNVIKLIKVDTNATLPEYKHQCDSGFDIASCESFVLKHGEFRHVHTGLQVADMPEGVELQIRPRSGLASKHGIVCITGTVDNCYRGEIGVILMNFGEDFQVNIGDRIAQCVPMMTHSIPVKMVSKEELVKTDRGNDGFGSTGINTDKVKGEN